MDADVIVVGAGAIGASVAKHLAKRGHRVVVLEKELGPAEHQSGRNSGVVHAGYNLKPGSAKARYCHEGNKALRRYCARRGVPLREDGILVVARTPRECAVLSELQRRAAANGVKSRLMGPDEFSRLEPHAWGLQALHAPEGASFDSRAYVHAFASDAIADGARFLYDTRVARIDEGDGAAHLATSKGRLSARVVVNCAGLHADRLARDLAHDVRVIPFRGFYAELRADRTDLVRSHVYAAPDLDFPFLGVHLSRRADGRVIVGPGAMLAMGREAYTLWGWNPRDLASTLGWGGLWRFLLRPEALRLTRREVAKSLLLRYIWKEARLLVPELRPGDLVRSYAGNRAQLLDRQGNLVEDILVRDSARGVHVLNAVSPGLTCSLPFGADLAARAEGKL